MNTKEYNGWTNYETWLLKLWQDNSEGDQGFWREQAEECVRRYPERTRTTSCSLTATVALMDIMKEQYEESASQLSGVTGFWADLLGAALSEVNWREIAEHWINEVEVEVA